MIRKCALVVLVLGAVVQASVSVTGNVKTLAGTAPGTGIKVQLTLQGCDSKDATVEGSYLGLDRTPSTTADPTTGAFTFATLAGNDEIKCNGQLNVTHWTVSIIKSGTTTPSWSANYIINAADGAANLNTKAKMTTAPLPATLDYAVRNQANTFTQSNDFTTATITRPFRWLAFASFPATCTANKDMLVRSDALTAGQAVYICNAAGNGWTLVGDGAGAAVAGTTGKLAKFTGAAVVGNSSVLTESGTTVTADGNLKIIDSGVEAWENFTLLSTPKWAAPAPYEGTFEGRQFKIGGLDTGGISNAGSNGGGVFLSDPLRGNLAGQHFLRVDIPEADGGLDIQRYYYGTDPLYGANNIGPMMFTYGKFPNTVGCPSGQGNHTMTIGNNNGYGGGPIDSFRPAWMMLVESNYQSTNCNLSMQEWHLHWTSPAKKPDGTTVTVFTHRPITVAVTLDRNANTITSDVGIVGDTIYFGDGVNAAGQTQTNHTNVNSAGNWIMNGTVTAASFSGVGTALTALNASNLSSGTVPAARIQEVLGVADLTDYASKSGSGTTAIGATMTSLAADDILKWSGANWVNATAAPKATALAANPTDCSANQYATTIDASGNLACAQVAYSQVSGTPALAAIATSGSASDLITGTVPAARLSLTSAELRTALSDETGTGLAVFQGGDLGAAVAVTAAANDNDTSVATTAYVQTELTALASDSQTLTNKGLDCEGTGNTCTVPAKIWLPAASVAGSTATLIWDSPASTPAVAAAVNGTNTIKGVADFADTAGGFSLQTTELLPADFTGNIDAKIVGMTSATSGNVKISLSTVCTATDGTETDDPAFNTASTVTTAAPGTTNRIFSSTISSVTITGCGAGELLHLKIFRDGNDASDTIAATWRFIGLELTIRRAM